MASLFGYAHFGINTFGDRSQGQALPPPPHVADNREQPVLVETNAPPSPAVTLPREQQVNPKREASSQ